METYARLSSKGQLTVPRSIREALNLRTGDRIVFRVDGDRALIARTPEFLALAGTVPTPISVRGLPWSEVIGRARKARAVNVAGTGATRLRSRRG